MTLTTWLARPLRRFLGTAVMLIGGQAFIHRLYFPPPELPPARVDRVVVDGFGSVYEIRAPAAARRIAAFIRGPRERDAVRMPEHMHHPPELYRLTFYRGDQARGTAIWVGRLISVPAGGRGHVWYYLTEREGADFQRLMRP